MERNGK